MTCRTSISRDEWNEPPTPLARRLSIAAMFGISPRPAPPPKLDEAALAAARSLEQRLPPGGIGLVSGPSGAGKSTVLRRVESIIRCRGGQVVTVASAAALLEETGSPLDLLDGSLHDDIRLLCAAGLAEPAVWIRPANMLSEGQRARVAIAAALREVADHDPGDEQPTLIADEFGSTLDRTSAMGLCAGLRRMMQGSVRCRVIAASAHDDLHEWLAPDVVLRVEAGFGHHAGHRISTTGSAA